MPRTVVDVYFLRVSLDAALKLASVARRAGDRTTVDYCLQTSRDALARVDSALEDETIAAAHPELREAAECLRRALSLDS